MNDIIKKHHAKNIAIGILIDAILIGAYVYIKINYLEISRSMPLDMLGFVLTGLIIFSVIFSVIFLLIPVFKINSPNNSLNDIVESGYLTEDALCDDYKNAKSVGKYKFGTYCIFVSSLYDIKVIQTASIIWMYCDASSKVIQEHNRIKIKQKFILHIYTKNKKHMIATVPHAEIAEDIMNKYQKYPFIVFGHSKELMKKYKKNFDDFLEIAYNKN